MPLKAAPLIIKPLIVLTVVAAEIAPDILIVVMPLSAPADDTFKPADCNVNVPVELPTAVLAVPVVLMLVVPITVAPPFKVAKPDTVNVPPKVDAPVPTVKLFAPVTLVAPFKLTAPVPVPNVPTPV